MEATYKKAIADQESKIKKYEQKMRDLIEAYKTLSKEKETLESTVKSLAAKDDHLVTRSDESETAKATNNQVATLSSAIATLTEEKRKMEKKYVEDKKLTRVEYETNVVALRAEIEAQSIVVRELNGQLNEARVERHKTAADSSQRFEQLASENRLLSARINELTVKLKSKEAIIDRLNEDSDDLRLLRDDLEAQMGSMKNGHECRVALLEETIADLSATIGHMEQQHLSDQDAIGKLMDKLKATGISVNRGDVVDNYYRKESQNDTPDILQFQESDKLMASASVDSIVEKMSQLLVQLQKLDPDTDMAASSIMLGRLESPVHQWLQLQRPVGGGGAECSGECVAKIDQLREELECCQLSMQELVKMNATVLPGSYQQQLIDRLNGELAGCKLKISKLQDELSNLDVASIRTMKSLKDEMTKTEWRHKQEVAKLQQESNQTVLELQTELSKHRNRTIELLSEKDAEIRSLQRSGPVKRYHANSSQDEHIDSDDEHADDSDSVSLGRRISSTCPLYQCCEMKARMDQQLRELRHNRRQLVMQIHKLESELEYAKSDWRSEVALLSAKVQRAESINKLSSGVNMEYLRNVLLRFLSTEDASCRRLMAKAIGKVLQFSGDELSSLQRHHGP